LNIQLELFKLRSQEFADQLPQFPPKKFFSLSLKEKEDRRVQLERFLQQRNHHLGFLLFTLRRCNLLLLTLDFSDANAGYFKQRRVHQLLPECAKGDATRNRNTSRLECVFDEFGQNHCANLFV
jgi:hypothetical protein